MQNILIAFETYGVSLHDTYLGTVRKYVNKKTVNNAANTDSSHNTAHDLLI